MLLRALHYGFSDGLDYADSEEAEAWVGRRLESMAEFASSNIPIWKDIFAQAGVRNIRCPGELSSLPLTGKRTLLSRPVEDRLGVPETECVKMSTSGTTGGPMPVYYSKEFYDYTTGMARFRGRRMQRVSTISKSAFITYDARASQGPTTKPLPVRRRNTLGFLTPLVGPLYDRVSKRFFISTGIHEVLPGLLKFDPRRLVASPAYLRMLAEVMLTNDGPKLHLDSALSIGEPLDEPTRLYLENVFGCDVFDTYGSNETGAVAVECRYKSGLHIISDSVLVEVLKDGRPVKANEEGDVYVTTLRNKAMPLFRYDMGDRAVLGDSNCPCGRKTLRLRSIEGRRSDYVAASDGRMVSPKRIGTIIHSVAGAPRCQLVELEYSCFHLRVFGNCESVVKQIVDLLLIELGDVQVQIIHERPDGLRAKFRPVVSMVTSSVDNRWTQPIKKIVKAE